MPLTISLESLKQAIRAGEQKRINLIQEGEEGVTQIAALQLMRELGKSSIETDGRDDGSQTITYDSALLRTLGIPIQHQLLMAESLAFLQVKANAAQVSFLTAAVTKRKETVLLGDVQRKTRLFALAEPHLQAFGERIRKHRLELADTEQTVLANPDENSIVRYQRRFRQLNEREAGLTNIANRVAKSANKAESLARASDLPDFAVDVAFQSGLIQGTKGDLNFSSSRDEGSFITNLAVRLAEQIKFV